MHILFYLGYTYFDPSSISPQDSTPIFEMCKSLSTNHNVATSIICLCPDGPYQNVNFINLQNAQCYLASNTFDAIVVMRYVYFFHEYHFVCPNVFFWLCD